VLTVRPGEKRLVEYLATEPQSLEGIRRFPSWPLIVEGSLPTAVERISADGPNEVLVREPNWSVVARDMSADLRTFTGLLSLVWCEPWQVRTAPTQSALLPPRVPDPRPSPPYWSDDRNDPDPHHEALPDWVTGAWDRIGRDRSLSTALASWHEGLLLTPSHPSFAHVAFVGAIENLASSAMFGQLVLDSVGAGAGSTKRFWAMVDLEATPEEAANLRAWKVDEKRGATAHGGGLHGIEQIYGAAILLEWVPSDAPGGVGRLDLSPSDPVANFLFRVLPTVQDIARRLLTRALG
jgi:hypothetical protein